MKAYRFMESTILHNSREQKKKGLKVHFIFLYISGGYNTTNKELPLFQKMLKKEYEELASSRLLDVCPQFVNPC